jgi:hypothetical protein
VSGPAFGTPVAKAEIGDCYFYPRRDAAHPVPTTHDASDEAFNPAPVRQDFRYLTYYVWFPQSPLSTSSTTHHVTSRMFSPSIETWRAP